MSRTKPSRGGVPRAIISNVWLTKWTAWSWSIFAQRALKYRRCGVGRFWWESRARQIRRLHFTWSVTAGCGNRVKSIPQI